MADLKLINVRTNCRSTTGTRRAIAVMRLEPSTSFPNYCMKHVIYRPCTLIISI